jgi:hypoxanthine phosphoribosyltransferase
MWLTLLRPSGGAFRLGILEIVLALFGIAGTVGTFYYGRKASQLAKERYSFSWEDVTRGCRELAKKGVKDFKPDIIVCFSGPSAIIGNLTVEFSHSFLPVYVVCIERLQNARNAVHEIAGYQPLQTSKWRLHVPKAVLLDKTKRVMLVDDATISGDSLFNLREVLVSQGFSRENTFTCSLICTKVAHDSKKAPDYYFYLLDTSEFYLPWGRGY